MNKKTFVNKAYEKFQYKAMIEVMLNKAILVVKVDVCLHAIFIVYQESTL
ncbi:hypothetical protein [Gelidibacter pelagius]|uniref:Transposase n=1 Tax=Gelidibacter pelagius TaxID=2819985 RepID=A0ABS3SX58_9FLAO|nr:hypothetical protein [Gelidibacter pelagius]MBO3100299.1 hypothetical protein [Gelidibacter pelagius]